mgnify:FL=1|jgi:hypothetical protein
MDKFTGFASASKRWLSPFFCAQNIKAVFDHLRHLNTASQIEISIFISLMRNVINLKGSLEFVF